jgi:hypothetical protein
MTADRLSRLPRPHWRAVSSVVVACAMFGVATTTAAQGSLRQSPEIAVPSAAEIAKAMPPLHLVAQPQGMMRVANPPPGTATPLRAVAASDSPVRSAFVNGVAMHVLAGQPAMAAPVATTAGAPGQMIERVMPNGTHVRLLMPSTVSTAPNAVAAPTPAFPIVDIDTAGHTLRPEDALRRDVLFRRVARLTP